MTRAEALTIAREHVEKMATNARGYQDGVNFVNKVGAVDAFARFLLEGTEPDAVAPRQEITARRRNLLVHLAEFQLGDGPAEYDADTRELLNELRAL